MTAFGAGQIVGRYRILRPLGTGAMGEVYLAQDPQIERLLAIKTVRMTAATPEAVEEHGRRLLREAKTAGRLIHPHIVTLFDAGEDGGTLFLAFEYVEGQSLDRLLAERVQAENPLPLGEALRIARQTAEGLDHAHRHGIVHRDVKPANLLLTGGGQVKISDFGIAKVAGQATELTVTGSVVGSPQYLSPEQIRGEDLDGRADLFSLGVVLYEMIGGRRPFDGDTFTTLLYKILHEPPPPVRLRPGLAPALSGLLGRMLSKERDERPSTAARVAEELAELKGFLGPELLAAPAAFGEGEAGSGSEGVAPTRIVPEGEAGAQSTRPGERSGEPAGTRPPPPPPPVPTPGDGVATGPISRSAPFAPGPPPASVLSVPGAGRTTEADGGRHSPKTLWIVGLAAALVVILVAVGAGVLGSRLLQGEEDLLARLRSGGGGVATTDGLDGGEPLGEISAPAPEPDEPPVEDPVRSDAPQEPPEGAEEVRQDAAAADPGESSSPGGTGEASPAGSVATGGKRRQVPALSENASEPDQQQSGAESGDGSELSPGARRLEQVLDRRPAVRRAARELATARGIETGPASNAGPDPEPGPEQEVDQRLRSGLRLAFRVQPLRAFVLIDGTVIGRADELDPATGGYTLPGEGEYLVTLRAPGMVDHRVLVQASRTGPDRTLVSARMEPAQAADLSLGDLRLYRVREAVGFEIAPPAARPVARVLVDGEPAGRVASFPGRFARANTWLRLAPGRHRISVVAPGFARRDVAVEVSSGAAERRERISIRLVPAQGGDGGRER